MQHGDARVRTPIRPFPDCAAGIAPQAFFVAGIFVLLALPVTVYEVNITFLQLKHFLAYIRVYLPVQISSSSIVPIKQSRLLLVSTQLTHYSGGHAPGVPVAAEATDPGHPHPVDGPHLRRRQVRDHLPPYLQLPASRVLCHSPSADMW